MNDIKLDNLYLQTNDCYRLVRSFVHCHQTTSQAEHPYILNFDKLDTNPSKL